MRGFESLRSVPGSACSTRACDTRFALGNEQVAFLGSECRRAIAWIVISPTSCDNFVRTHRSAEDEYEKLPIPLDRGFEQGIAVLLNA